MNQDNIKNIGNRLNSLKQAANDLNATIESLKVNDFALGNYIRNLKTLSLQMKDLCVSCDRQLMFLSNEFRGFNQRKRTMLEKRKRDIEALRRLERKERKNKQEGI